MLHIHPQIQLLPITDPRGDVGDLIDGDGFAQSCAASKDGHVISGEPTDRYGRRSNPASKRFGRLRTREGFGREVVFHSIRKTVATMLENAGVSENVAADILGHQKPRITYGLYSGGTTLEVKRAAIEALSYGQ